MTLAAAVAATLAAGTARVRLSRLTGDGTALRDLSGVADLRARRCLVTGHPTAAGAEQAERLATALAEQWPWLGEAVERDDDSPMAIYEAGSAGWHRHGGRWSLLRGGDPLAGEWEPTSELWIIDRLAAASGSPGAFRLPDCEGEARVSATGLIETVVWSPRQWRRPRSPLPAFDDARLWRAVTLWDHGLPVTFDVPDLDQPSAIRTFAQAARAVHRARKAYG